MQSTFSRFFNRPERSLLLLAALPITFVIILVINYGYTVPWLDEYGHIVQMIIAQLNGDLTISQVARQVGDHRLLFPFLISLFFVELNGGNTAWEMGFSILLMLISVFLVYRIYRMQHRQQEHALYFVIPVAFLIFSLGQRDNWIWGSQKCIFLMLACLYVVAWALERFPKSKTAFVIGVLGATIASWSFLSGNILWFVIPVAMWLNGYRKISTYLLWIAFAAVHFFLFLNGYVRTGEDQSVGAVSLFANLRYLLTFVGSPLSPETHFLGQNYSLPGSSPTTTRYAGIMGALGIVLLIANLIYALFVRKMSLREFSPWALLISFSLGNGLLLSLGRAWDFYFALAARYITMAIPFWIGLVALMFANTTHYWRERSTPNWLPKLLLVINLCASIIFLGGYVANLYRAIEGRETLKNAMELCYLTKMNGDPRCQQLQFFANYNPADLVSLQSNQDRIDVLHQHRMFILNQSSNSISLLDMPRNVVQGTDVRIMDYGVPGDATEQVLFMHAPAVVEQAINVPDVPGDIFLRTAAYLETSTLTSNPEVAQDGAVFRIQLLDEEHNELDSHEVLFEATPGHPPIPVELDLSEYAGRNIVVVYETENRELPAYDWTMWIDPRIEIQRAAD